MNYYHHHTVDPSDLLPVGGDDLGQVNNALGVSPLVIVPSDHLDHVVTHNHGESRVDGGRDIGHSVIARHEGLIRDAQNAVEWSVGGLTESFVDLLGESLLLDLDDQIDHGHGGGRDTESDTVQLALELGEDEGDRLGGTGGGGDDVQGGGTGATEIAVGSIEKTLVTGVGVGGGHGALDDAKLLVEDLDERSEAVGGARSVRDDGVGVGVLVGVDTNDVGGDVGALGGSGDEDLLGAGFDVLGGTLGVDEDTGTFDHEIDVHSSPGELERVTGRDDLDLLAVDGEGVLAGDLDVSGEGTHGGVVLEQVGSLLDTSRIVDSDDLEVGVGTALPAAEELATDAAETVDGNADLLGGDGDLARTSTGLREVGEWVWVRSMRKDEIRLK